MNVMEFRPHTWIDTKALEPLYGIQAKKPGGKWRHVISDGKILLFANAEDRDREMLELRRRVKEEVCETLDAEG